ncbi:hypothetical protein Aduo_004916 [Ancylostoma duodenale]
MLLLVTLLVTLLLVNVDCQSVDGAAASRPHQLSQARVFDLPKFAPTARIIKLSTTLGRRKRRRGEEDLFRDAAGSFDNFEAFDLENLEPSSDGSTSPRKPQKSSHRGKPSKEEDIGNFFPETK